MSGEINVGVRKSNYERGMKYGEKVYCGMDLKDLVGMKIVDVSSDEMDNDVMMFLEGDNDCATVYFDNMCFDGEHMSIVNGFDESDSCLLRPVTEKDLQEISSMKHYYDNDIINEYDVKVGVHHTYCNNIDLEGTDKFILKSLLVFYDGKIMTEKDVEG